MKNLPAREYLPGSGAVCGMHHSVDVGIDPGLVCAERASAVQHPGRGLRQLSRLLLSGAVRLEGGRVGVAGGRQVVVSSRLAHFHCRARVRNARNVDDCDRSD